MVSLYLPSGSSGPERQAVKMQVLDTLYQEDLARWRSEKSAFILCGDWNIVHKNIDIKNWRSNQKSSGCLPEERAWLDQVFDDMGWVDAFRVVNQEADEYTWWSFRGQARAKNVGWRIDYQVVSPQLAPQILSAQIFRDRFFSDHAPLIVCYDIPS